MYDTRRVQIVMLEQRLKSLLERFTHLSLTEQDRQILQGEIIATSQILADRRVPQDFGPTFRIPADRADRERVPPLGKGDEDRL